jgi:UPF0059 membrane protein FAEPRAA2165_00248
MNVQAGFILNSILLGAGLAMDAVSVSVANGLEEPGMSGKKNAGIAGIFALFQWLMPMLGWFFVTSLLSVFRAVDPFLPFVSFALLLYIGGKLCLEGIKGETDENPDSGLGMKALFLQGIATSIDALSVGFTLAYYRAAEALLSSVLIALTTFFLCLGALHAGKQAGAVLNRQAKILGGLILIVIGARIFIAG